MIKDREKHANEELKYEANLISNGSQVIQKQINWNRQHK